MRLSRATSSAAPPTDVWFAIKGGSLPKDRPPSIEGPLQKRGGSHGGARQLEDEVCRRLIGSTLYYMESEKATSAKGHVVRLLGLAFARPTTKSVVHTPSVSIGLMAPSRVQPST